MDNNPQTWQVSPAQYQALSDMLKADTGIVIGGDSGTMKIHGVEASWIFDGAKLSITVLSAPPFCTGTAQRQIKSSVDAALKQA